MIYGRKATTETEQKLILRCYKEGLKNGWASGKFAELDGDFIVKEDRLNENSICFIDDIKTLMNFFKCGNWCLGQGVIYKNLFFLQQNNGGDEWAIYKIDDNNIFQFESYSCGRVIKDKPQEFKDDIKIMTIAENKHLINLTY